MKLLATILITLFSANSMAEVTGIGGFFFKADDPKGLAVWYETHLGIKQTPTSYGETPWMQEAGATVFQPFPKITKYFGAKDWMLNLRVRDLKGMVTKLQAAGIKVDVDPVQYPNGLFARLEDPEGNPIQLWEPKETAKKQK